MRCSWHGTLAEAPLRTEAKVKRFSMLRSTRKSATQLSFCVWSERIITMNRRKFIHAIGLASVSFLLFSCTSTGIMVGQPGGKGPPPHAPAHGYRRKNRQGLQMTFDSNLGVYIMVDYPMHYYWDGRYYRKSKKKWESSQNINKQWKSIKKQQLPRGLQNK